MAETSTGEARFASLLRDSGRKKEEAGNTTFIYAPDLVNTTFTLLYSDRLIPRHPVFPAELSHRKTEPVVISRMQKRSCGRSPS